jgi:hypothetical protein
MDIGDWSANEYEETHQAFYDRAVGFNGKQEQLLEKG